MRADRLPQEISCLLPAGHRLLDPAVPPAELPLGAHLITPRRRYSHHGIYVGAGTVIHYAGLCYSLRSLPIQEASLTEFADGYPLVYLPLRPSRYVGFEAVARARSRLGENAYDLLKNNCEHFCTWCLDGQAHSEQAERLLTLPARLLERAMARIAALRTRSTDPIAAGGSH